MLPDDPIWLRSVAVVAALLGLRDDELSVGFCDDDAAVISRRRKLLRPIGSERQRSAEAIADEQRAVLRPGIEPTSEVRGARFVARWLRGLPPDERTVVVHGLDPATARAITPLVPNVGMLSDRAIAAWLVLNARDVAGGLPTAVAWTGVLRALAGEGQTTALGARVERRARVSGRGARCRALALEIPE